MLTRGPLGQPAGARDRRRTGADRFRGLQLVRILPAQGHAGRHHAPPHDATVAPWRPPRCRRSCTHRRHRGGARAPLVGLSAGFRRKRDRPLGGADPGERGVVELGVKVGCCQDSCAAGRSGRNAATAAGCGGAISTGSIAARVSASALTKSENQFCTVARACRSWPSSVRAAPRATSERRGNLLRHAVDIVRIDQHRGVELLGGAGELG